MNLNPLRSTIYPHIDLSFPDSPTIQGTTMKVVELINAQRAHGWSPAELHFQVPHIAMSQVYAAFLKSDANNRFVIAELENCYGYLYSRNCN